MTAAVKSGLAYFALVFGVGFLLGTVRVLVLVPSIGERLAVLVELPVILSAAWLICRWLIDRFEVPRRWPSRLVMGGVAFGLLMIAELVLSTLVFGNSLRGHLAAYTTLHGALGLAGQVMFGAFPLLQLQGNRRQSAP